MKINAELDKIDDEFYVDEGKQTDKKENNAPSLPVAFLQHF
jgi:hypothetical protein